MFYSSWHPGPGILCLPKSRFPLLLSAIYSPLNLPSASCRNITLTLWEAAPQPNIILLSRMQRKLCLHQGSDAEYKVCSLSEQVSLVQVQAEERRSLPCPVLLTRQDRTSCTMPPSAASPTASIKIFLFQHFPPGTPLDGPWAARVRTASRPPEIRETEEPAPCLAEADWEAGSCWGPRSRREAAFLTQHHLGFHLPWRLGSHRGVCVTPETAEDAEAAAGEQLNSNVLKYKFWLEDSAREQLGHANIQSGFLETLYQNRSNLKTIFRVMDSDHSGYISLDEFGQTWKLFSSHMNTDVTDDCVCNLVRSIDFNKDGHIDINEFQDTFHLVSSPAQGAMPPTAQKPQTLMRVATAGQEHTTNSLVSAAQRCLVSNTELVAGTAPLFSIHL
ncbi:Serine/threonine-protein phosphatase with EF-hands 2 [Manis javanica]|nr:Serine/threonine-protein phosphatase with EF-hands 2 [Manis javanica]